MITLFCIFLMIALFVSIIKLFAWMVKAAFHLIPFLFEVILVIAALYIAWYLFQFIGIVAVIIILAIGYHAVIK